MVRDVRVGPFLRSMILDMTPMLSIVVLILLTVIPHTIPAIMRAGSLWPLIGIAYWTLARPRNMPPTMVFCLGLLVDLLAFVPLGIHALIFVAAQVILKKQRRFLMGQGFWVLWAAYALLALSVYTALYIMISAFQPSSLSYVQGLVGVGVAWTCVPIVVALLSALHEVIDLFDEPVV